jgi:hypothetical protein
VASGAVAAVVWGARTNAWERSPFLAARYMGATRACAEEVMARRNGSTGRGWMGWTGWLGLGS